MSFTKFVDLLSTQSLFFSRSDRFADPFEGSIPVAAHERQLKELGQRSGYQGMEGQVNSAAVVKRMREYVFINCLHLSEYESEALWSLYVRNSEGVAIRISRGSVYSALASSKETKDVWSVPVQYIDFASDDPPIPTAMAPFRYKRRSFEHVKELRFIHYAPTSSYNGDLLAPPDEFGIHLRVDIASLVHAVYVAPTSPPWFHRLTADICAKYALSAPVHKSDLASSAPLFGA